QCPCQVMPTMDDTLAVELLANPELSAPISTILRHVPPSDIPASSDLLSRTALERYLERLAEPPLSLVAVGDVMIGGRARRIVARHGPGYPFEAVEPMLRRAPIVMGNLEGPLARVARKQPRNHSYRLSPDVGVALKR